MADPFVVPESRPDYSGGPGHGRPQARVSRPAGAYTPYSGQSRRHGSGEESGYFPYPDFPGPAYAGEHPTQRRTDSSGTRTLWILSFVFAGIAVAFLPILFGPAAIVCGAVAWGRGSSVGRIATFVAIAATAVGIALGVLVTSL